MEAIIEAAARGMSS